jgi:sugar lactone lactonase YvrE
MEVFRDGTQKPYPSEEWAQAPTQKNPTIGISNAIGLRAGLDGYLYVLDLGSPTHQPKIVQIDLNKDAVVSIFYIPKEVLTAQSFLQDFALDSDKGKIYIADMGQADPALPAKPALLRLDTKSGKIVRLMDTHPSFFPSKKGMKVDGKPVFLYKDGKETSLNLALNPITIDQNSGYLYWAPMGYGSLKRIALPYLNDDTIDLKKINSVIETIGTKPWSDGMTIDRDGNIYITDLDKNAIGVLNPKGHYSIYLQDDRLKWADGLSFGPDGKIYVTINQLHLAQAFSKDGTDQSIKPYLLARFEPLHGAALAANNEILRSQFDQMPPKRLIQIVTFLLR